ncbi:MAG: efflux RND transporter periplasmic adaptor subunit [Candidatus Synoicihabitans palmerolidicus]|nr:efflux RND transporter periplasmic adaptor subunit [Candidatus Synoicihabitans palmerolidicus]
MAKAQNQLVQADLQLQRALATAPLAGTVIECFAVPGLPAHNALIQVSDITDMVVVAEVYEGDILKFEVGAKATVSNASLPEVMHGTVVSIGRQISAGSRVAQVQLELAEDELAAQFIGMEVHVTIQR